MILYHFTAMENVEAIQRDGLRALLQGSHDSSTILGTCDKPAVYLTDLPTTEMFHHGLPMARFTIRLTSHDRKLKLYGLWLRANYHRIDGLPDPDSDNVIVRRAMTEWWLYFGDIPPSKIVEFTVEEAIPLSASASLTMGGSAGLDCA
ncbi:MAG TPA: hypothetical protein VFP43_21670 [Mesorhizobium sp.]|nr:hypothetical protein [Mesorhizobium sp.]